MNTNELENCKKIKMEYDSKIRDYDYKIVDLSIAMFDAKRQEKGSDNIDEVKPYEKFFYEIQKQEKEKEELTTQTWNKIYGFKTKLIEDIDKELRKTNDGNLKKMRFSINKINSVYFNITEIDGIVDGSSLPEIKKEKTVEQLVEEKKKEAEVPEIKPEPVQVIDIKEQRIKDFKNILQNISELSGGFRLEVEKNINKFLKNCIVLKNSETLKDKFNNISNKYISEFKDVLAQIEKQESLSEINKKIEEIQAENDEMALENKNLLAEYEYMKKQVQELESVYLVGGYAKKISESLLKEDEKVSNYNDEVIFETIKKLTQDSRMAHIIEVEKWSTKIKENLKEQTIEETDFQFILYLARQTENICNSGYEEIANYVISLCDSWIKFEELDKVNKVEKTKLLQGNKDTNTLKNGISSIKKKYLKIPFIGRKIACILNLNAKKLTE